MPLVHSLEIFSPCLKRISGEQCALRFYSHVYCLHASTVLVLPCTHGSVASSQGKGGSEILLSDIHFLMVLYPAMEPNFIKIIGNYYLWTLQ